MLHYRADSAGDLQSGDRLRELTFENVRFTGLKHGSRVEASAEEPLTVHLRDVTAGFETGVGSLFDPESPNLRIMTD